MKPKKPYSSPKPERRWCFRDLVTDPVSGKLRETLLYSNLGKLAALLWFNWKCWKGTDSVELWLVVMGVLTCHAAFSQFVSSRMNIQTKAK